MKEPVSEIQRLLDLMPASGRMLAKIVSKPQQAQVIDTPFPLPWSKDRPIWINFDLWHQLSVPQRDLLLLRTVSWLSQIRWFKPDWYQGVVAAGLAGSVVELIQGDIVGVIVAGGLSVLAGSQIWRSYHSSQIELAADEAAIHVAMRRGYNETEAASALLKAIEAQAQLEGRVGLNFTELIRSQNLKALAGLSAVGVPNSIKNRNR